MSKKQKRYVYLGIFFLCLFLYGNSMNNDYALDDEYVIVNNPLVEKGIKGIPKIFRSHYVNKDIEKHSYRPVTLTSFAIEYQFAGANPKVSHFINLLLYGLTCMLLFRILLRLFREYHWSLAVLATFFFLLLPVHSEVVNNVKSRDELLCFLFALLSMYQFIKYADHKRWLSLVLGILFILLSLMSKLSSLTFLAIIPLTLWFFTEIKFKKLIVLTVGICLAFVAMKFGIGQVLDAGSSVRDSMFFENPLHTAKGGIITKIPMAFFTTVYYLKLLIFPKTLLCYYGYNHVPIVGWGSMYFWISAIILLPVAVFALVKIKTKSPLVFGILYFFIAISMFSNLVQPAAGIIAERFVYIPSLGFSIVMAFLILKLSKAAMMNLDKKFTIERKVLFFSILGIVLVLSAARIVTRTKDWKDKITLLRHDIVDADDSAKLNALLANSLFLKTGGNSGLPGNRYSVEAIKYYRKSVEIYPEYKTSWNNMGTLYFNQLRDFEEAKKCYEKAIELDPEYVTALFGLAYYYEIKEEYAKSKTYFERVIKLEPDNVRAMDHLKAVIEAEKV